MSSSRGNSPAYEYGRSTASRNTTPLFQSLRARRRLARARLAAERRQDLRQRATSDRQSAGAQADALSAPGEERDLPVHGRRSQPARVIRLQAEAAGVARQADPGLVPEGEALRLHGYVCQGRPQAAGHSAEVRAP